MLVLFGAVALVLADRQRKRRESPARARGRHGDPSLRCAPRWAPAAARLARQVLAESPVLAVAGTAQSRLAVTWWSLQGLVALVPRACRGSSRCASTPAMVLRGRGSRFVTAAVAGLAPALSRRCGWIWSRSFAAADAAWSAVPRRLGRRRWWWRRWRSQSPWWRLPGC